MPAPPPGMIESDAEYEWRKAVRYGDRYPIPADTQNRDFHEGRIRVGRAWQRFGEITGIWRPFLTWADRVDLLD
jgi:hypothetical protein